MSSKIAQKSARPYQKSGLYHLKRAVLQLGRRAIDHRTQVGKALVAWRANLLADLGGEENCSTQELALVDAALRTKLILDSVDGWLVMQKSLINQRSRRIIHAASHDRAALVRTLQSLLLSLGLKRRAKPVKSLDAFIREHDAAKAAAGAADPAEREPALSGNGVEVSES